MKLRIPLRGFCRYVSFFHKQIRLEEAVDPSDQVDALLLSQAGLAGLASSLSADEPVPLSSQRCLHLTATTLR